MWKEGCTVLPPQADGFASTRPEQCWKPEALLVLPNSLSICFPWREHPGMVAVSPPGSCATKRGSLRLWILPQCFSREASGGLGEELGSGNKPPCVWGPQLFYTDILVNAYSVLGIFFFYLFLLPHSMAAASSSHILSKVKQFVSWLSLGGSFYSLKFSFPLPCDLSPLMSSGKLWFCTLFSIFLLGWEWQSHGFLHPKQEQNSQCIIDTTFHFTSTLVWRIDDMATEGKIQAQATGTWQMPSGQCQLQSSLPLWVPAVVFCCPERILLIFL